MKHRQTFPPTWVLGSLAVIVAAASLAGCMVGDADEDDEIGAFYAGLPEEDCAGVKEWALNTIYPIGTKVTDTGDVFRARYSHTAFAPNWNPKNAGSIWLAVGRCSGGGGGGGGQPQPQPQPQPLPPPPGQCAPNGRPGPIFDPAGTKNVGNGRGEQFIGGQCLDTADCASGCCARPCGICSGPGAQFQNGKQGCGFGG